jgi:hypothetical protein
LFGHLLNLAQDPIWMIAIVIVPLAHNVTCSGVEGNVSQPTESASGFSGCHMNIVNSLVIDMVFQYPAIGLIFGDDDQFAPGVGLIDEIADRPLC